MDSERKYESIQTFIFNFKEFNDFDLFLFSLLYFSFCRGTLFACLKFCFLMTVDCINFMAVEKSVEESLDSNYINKFDYSTLSVSILCSFFYIFI